MSNEPNLALAIVELILILLPGLGLALASDVFPKRSRDKIIKYIFIGALAGLVACSVLELASVASGAMLILAPLALLFYVVIPFGAWCFSFLCELPEWDERRRAAKAKAPNDVDV